VVLASFNREDDLKKYLPFSSSSFLSDRCRSKKEVCHPSEPTEYYQYSSLSLDFHQVDRFNHSYNMSEAPVPPPAASPRPFFQAPPTPGSPRSQHASFGPRTPLSPSFRAPLSPRTPLSPRRPSPPGAFYPPTGGLEPQTPHGFVPMRRDSTAPFDPKTPMSATFKEEEAVVQAEEEVTKIDRKDLVCLTMPWFGVPRGIC